MPENSLTFWWLDLIVGQHENSCNHKDSYITHATFSMRKTSTQHTTLPVPDWLATPLYNNKL